MKKPEMAHSGHSPVCDEKRGQVSHPSGLDDMKEELNKAELTAYLSKQEDIIAAYLFGSQATGRQRSESDLDIAVLLKEDYSAVRLDRRLKMADEMSLLAGIETDVVILNDAPCVLTHQILKTGRLLHERDRGARMDFEVMAGKIYADLGPSRRFFREALLREIRENRLGG